MNSVAEAIGLGLRFPFWLVGNVLAVIWTLAFGGLNRWLARGSSRRY